MQNVIWTRRDMLRTATIAAIGYPTLNLISCVNQPAINDQTKAVALLVPDWIGPGKLRWVWALWEPIYMMRRGGHAKGVGDGNATGHWVLKWYERMHSDEILDKLADVGVNLVTTHFFKGFGLKAEAEEMDRAKDFARRAHARGIRVLGYHQFSTAVYETLKDEIPDLADMIQRGPDGVFRTYGAGVVYWRWMACPIHDEYIAYLKKVIDHTLIYADLDGVEYDGNVYDCYCEKCQTSFRNWIIKQNPDPLERFGIPHFRNIRMPTTPNDHDPVWQELVKYRRDFMGKRLQEMREYIHSKKKDAALVTYVRENLDLSISENYGLPTIIKGELITKVRELKEGITINQIILSTDWQLSERGGTTLPVAAKNVELDMAECLACGGHVLTATWAMRSGDKRDGSAVFELPEFNNALKLYMNFAQKNEHLQESIKPCANVWVYHTNSDPNNVLGFEQALLGRIAYREAREKHLDQLTSRDVLIVASQLRLSDKECNAIRAAVEKGCGLIITGNTADFDENFRQREKAALTDLYTKANVRYFAECPGTTSAPVRGSSAVPMPARAAEILKAVKELASQGFAAELTGGNDLQPYTFVDVFQQPTGCVAHIVYYGDGEAKGLKLKLAAWLKPGEPTMYTPYLPEPVKLQKSSDGWISIPSSMGRYCAVKFT